MNDPAADAAQRMWALNGWLYGTGGRELAEVAAREALKPLRELHRPLDRPISWGNTQTERVCHHCLGPVKWPCATARLVYSSEELS